MPYIADLHLHSRFSRACSKDINIPQLAKWAKIKGIDLLGTGDFLHPVWRGEIKLALRDLGNGFYDYDGVKFVLSTEIACIYSDLAKVKRIHLVILLPSFASAEKLSSELLKKKVNLASDGRPITGLSAYEITKIVLSVDPKATIIPAHIWTPHFSLFGSLSGYDFLEQCFKDLSKEILAIETGLSSDSSMNWRVANLDQKAILSFSDAHSVANLAREVTIFAGGLSYDELLDDLKKQNISETIEFYPEEGMYHFSGHRDCHVSYSPEEVKEKGEICPVCGKRLTIGVMQRVEDLASRSIDDLKLQNVDGLIKSANFPTRPGYRMLVGLDKIIAESFGVGRGAKKTQAEYDKLVGMLDSELMILTKIPLSKIASLAGEKIAEGVDRVRMGNVKINPGYDGTYGVIRIWGEEESGDKVIQPTLF